MLSKVFEKTVAYSSFQMHLHSGYCEVQRSTFANYIQSKQLNTLFI